MPDPAAAAAPAVRRTLVLVLLLNLAVAAAKLVVGVLVASLSMVADGFHSVVDATANVVGLIGISWAARPPDEDHPYGHWKFETLAALMIGGLLALTSWEILRSAAGRLLGGGAPEVTFTAFAVMIVTMAVNVAVSAYERRRARELGSDILSADAAHTASDAWVSLSVIGSLIAARWGYPQIDLLAALVIAVVIARAALRILRDNTRHLTDEAAVPAPDIEAVALAVPGVRGVHKVRTRTDPAGGHADLHLQLAPDLPLDRAHAIGHQVADRIREEFGLEDVVTHVEPPVGHRPDPPAGETAKGGPGPDDR